MLFSYPSLSPVRRAKCPVTSPRGKKSKLPWAYCGSPSFVIFVFLIQKLLVHSEIESELASITITDCLLENMDVDKDEMIEAAKRNLQAQIQFMDIREVMKSMGVPVPECNPDTDISMIAITNTSKINGAGVLLD